MSYVETLKRGAHDVCSEINSLSLDGFDVPIFDLPLHERYLDLIEISKEFNKHKESLEKSMGQFYGYSQIYHHAVEVFERISYYLAGAGPLFSAADELILALREISYSALFNSVNFGDNTRDSLLTRKEGNRAYQDLITLVRAVLSMDSVVLRDKNDSLSWIHERLETLEVLVLMAENKD